MIHGDNHAKLGKVLKVHIRTDKEIQLEVVVCTKTTIYLRKRMKKPQAKIGMKSSFQYHSLNAKKAKNRGLTSFEPPNPTVDLIMS